MKLLPWMMLYDEHIFAQQKKPGANFIVLTNQGGNTEELKTSTF